MYWHASRPLLPSVPSPQSSYRHAPSSQKTPTTTEKKRCLWISTVVAETALPNTLTSCSGPLQMCLPHKPKAVIPSGHVLIAQGRLLLLAYASGQRMYVILSYFRPIQDSKHLVPLFPSVDMGALYRPRRALLLRLWTCELARVAAKLVARLHYYHPSVFITELQDNDRTAP